MLWPIGNYACLSDTENTQTVQKHCDNELTVPWSRFLAFGRLTDLRSLVACGLCQLHRCLDALNVHVLSVFRYLLVHNENSKLQAVDAPWQAVSWLEESPSTTRNKAKECFCMCITLNQADLLLRNRRQTCTWKVPILIRFNADKDYRGMNCLFGSP